MKSNFKKIILVSITVCIIYPSLTFASWYNPFTWNFHGFGQAIASKLSSWTGLDKIFGSHNVAPNIKTVDNNLVTKDNGVSPETQNYSNPQEFGWEKDVPESFFSDCHLAINDTRPDGDECKIDVGYNYSLCKAYNIASKYYFNKNTDSNFNPLQSLGDCSRSSGSSKCDEKNSSCYKACGDNNATCINKCTQQSCSCETSSDKNELSCINDLVKKHSSK